MPLYSGVAGSFAIAPNPPISLEAGNSCFLFGVAPSAATTLPATDANVTGEAIVAGQSSVPLTVMGRPQGGSPSALSFEGRFSGAPGAFEIDIQEADSDADANYILPTGSTAYKVTTVDANNHWRVDLIPTGGKFMRVKMVALANAVNSIVKATCLD